MKNMYVHGLFEKYAQKIVKNKRQTVCNHILEYINNVVKICLLHGPSAPGWLAGWLAVWCPGWPDWLPGRSLPWAWPGLGPGQGAWPGTPGLGVLALALVVAWECVQAGFEAGPRSQAWPWPGWLGYQKLVQN